MTKSMHASRAPLVIFVCAISAACGEGDGGPGVGGHANDGGTANGGGVGHVAATAGAGGQGDNTGGATATGSGGQTTMGAKGGAAGGATAGASGSAGMRGSAGALGAAGASGTGGVPSAGLTISADGRRLEKDGAPFFWLCDTEYLMFHEATPAQVSTVLDVRKQQGFNVIKLYDNVDGNYTDRIMPGGVISESYVQTHFDTVVSEIEKRDMYMVIVLHESSPLSFATFLTQRYQAHSHVLFWVLHNGMDDWITAIRDNVGPRALPGSYIYEADQSETWRTVYTAVGGGDAERLYATKPVRPVLMADGMYDADSGGDDSIGGAFDRSPFGIRRGAWVTFAHGGFFTYGRPPAWAYPAGFEAELHYESSQYLTLFQNYWTSRAWAALVPDDMLVSAVQASDSTVTNFIGALKSSAAIYVYFPGPGSAQVSLKPLTATNASSTWFNPKTGATSAGPNFATSVTPTVSPPAGWEDAVLEIKGN